MRILKIVGLLIVGLVVLLLVLLSIWGCYWMSSPEEFNRNADIFLAAHCTDSGKPPQVRFGLRLSSKKDVIWPGGAELRVYVDGKLQTNSPLAKWSWYSSYDHILPNAPRRAYWYMDLAELIRWLGVGVHEISYEFGDIKSNSLRVEVGSNNTVNFSPLLIPAEWFSPSVGVQSNPPPENLEKTGVEKGKIEE